MNSIIRLPVLQITDSELQITDIVLQITDYGFRITDSVLQITDSVLQITDSVLQMTEYNYYYWDNMVSTTAKQLVRRNVVYIIHNSEY